MAYHQGIEARHYASRVIVRESLGRICLRELRHRFSKAKMKTPPYDHVCQVGDPILRGESSPVNPRQIKSAEVQNAIKMMTKVMRSAGAVGCAAPQVGMAKQIVVMEFTKEHMESLEKEVQKAREVTVFPLKVFINPELKVIDPRIVTLLEGCLSISGYDACVPRAYGVELSGLNELGQPVTWSTTGYSARIVQHEMDHLRGKLFIDIMDSSTFVDKEWPRWNLK
ncbi:peptide deformylase, mitochondrial-like [Patiria miniata]|uniref:Peptide deformylase n=1 Tax=Patiria miniata TaxID=46514 RepID=A0A914B290_PATMI|nr:peptide deformylase, mitochondrial-like [Patiria miniata]